MSSLLNKQLLLTAYAYLFIMEQQKELRGSDALNIKGGDCCTIADNVHDPGAKQIMEKKEREAKRINEKKHSECSDDELLRELPEVVSFAQPQISTKTTHNSSEEVKQGANSQPKKEQQRIEETPAVVVKMNDEIRKDDEILIGTVIWKVKQCLAGCQGGEASVWVLEHAVQGAVVLKIPNDGRTVVFKERELRNHLHVMEKKVPHILPLRHHGEITLKDGKRKPYLTTTFMEGGDLCSFITKRTAVAKMLTDTLTAVVELAKADVVHADIKYDNIMVDKHGNCYLGDFGSSYGFGQSMTRFDSPVMLAATPEYTAPAHIAIKKANASTLVEELRRADAQILIAMMLVEQRGTNFQKTQWTPSAWSFALWDENEDEVSTKLIEGLMARGKDKGSFEKCFLPEFEKRQKQRKALQNERDALFNKSKVLRQVAQQALSSPLLFK